MGTVSKMGTSEWFECEMATVRAAAKSYLHEHLLYSGADNIDNFTDDEIRTYIESLVPAVRVLVKAAFYLDEPQNIAVLRLALATETIGGDA